MHLQEFYESSENLFRPFLYDRIGRLLLCFLAKTNMSQMYLVEKSIIFQHAYLVIELVMF